MGSLYRPVPQKTFERFFFFPPRVTGLLVLAEGMWGIDRSTLPLLAFVWEIARFLTSIGAFSLRKKDAQAWLQLPNQTMNSGV